ncbi:ribbon-helix-helix protein, CopG family [Bosea sp. F3-2]|uniref:CopG family ribbon-helix-helix protein n=1 Tax=Bosea sp. F3-2 TaxID=2599640 RepID=UPI0011EECD38|nr:ribbon-helix-helix protein, CopG family [Bosea sp. F3-2]QEL24616.1 ribbon-helix-helix protein, CopG family [Bosea sp. F3-2]
MDITIEVEATLADRLTRLATDMHRSPAWVIARAIEDYVQLNASDVARIREGIAEADRGEFATDEEIEAIFRKLHDRDQQS